MTTTSDLAAADLKAGRITETAKIVVISAVQYQIDEFDCLITDAVENVADEFGVRFAVILDIVDGRVRD
jgi:hypothetical protein